MLTKASSSIKFGTQIVQLLVKLTHLDGFGFPSVRHTICLVAVRARSAYTDCKPSRQALATPTRAQVSPKSTNGLPSSNSSHAGTRNAATQFHELATMDREQFANANESVQDFFKHGGFHETEVVRRPWRACRSSNGRVERTRWTPWYVGPAW
jgi:hypothetical protein